MDKLILLLLIPLITVYSHLDSERKCTHSACYNSSGNIFMNGSCNQGEIIAMDGKVHVGAKLLNGSSKTCKKECNHKVGHNMCCVQDDDCTLEYINTNESRTFTYHHNCTGLHACKDGLRAERLDHIDCVPGYPDTTTYMFMDFYCIPTSRIRKCDDSPWKITQTRSSKIYIMNPAYPQNNSNNFSCSCKMWTVNTSFIEVTELDVRLTPPDKLSFFKDNSSAQNFEAHDNEFEIKNLLNSSSHILYLNANLVGGVFWLAFSANDNSPLTIQCPADDEVHVIPPLPIYQDTTSKKFQWWLILAIIGAVVMVLALAGFIYRKKQQHKKEDDEIDKENYSFVSDINGNVEGSTPPKLSQVPSGKVPETQRKNGIGPLFPKSSDTKIPKANVLQPLQNEYNTSSPRPIEEKRERKKKKQKRKMKQKKKNKVDPANIDDREEETDDSKSMNKDQE